MLDIKTSLISKGETKEMVDTRAPRATLEQTVGKHSILPPK